MTHSCTLDSSSNVSPMLLLTFPIAGKMTEGSCCDGEKRVTCRSLAQGPGSGTSRVLEGEPLTSDYPILHL